MNKQLKKMRARENHRRMMNRFDRKNLKPKELFMIMVKRDDIQQDQSKHIIKNRYPDYDPREHRKKVQKILYR